MAEQQKSVVQQIEEQAGEQLKLRVTQAIRRTGVENAEGVTEYLSQFGAAKELAQNQEEFSLRIKRIRENVDLTGEERLDAGREAAEEALDRHTGLLAELQRQAASRRDKLERSLFHTSDTATLHALADLEEKQLDTRADIAQSSGNSEMLRAIRAVAETKGFTDVVTKTIAQDPGPETVSTYLEREKLQNSGALEALSGAYLPPPVREEQLQPTTAEVEHAQRVRESERASARRVMEGRPGITDIDYSRGPARQVGRKRA